MPSHNVKREKHLNGSETRSDTQENGVSTHDSVEEAVLKYVRDGFQQNDLQKMSSDNGNGGNDQGDDENNEGKNNGNTSASAATNDDMSWYLKHDEDINQYDRQGASATNEDDSQAATSESVAMAAVAAAYASSSSTLGKSEKRKHKKTHRDNDGKKSKKHKKQKKNPETDIVKEDVTSIAVDPALATLDNDEGNDPSNNAQDQLVRKAIIDTDSITQNPDFQQYLNTDISTKDEPLTKKVTTEKTKKPKTKKSSDESDSATLVDPVSMEEPEVPTKNYNDLSKDYEGVLPKGVSITNVGLKTDKDTHLLQSAATDASKMIREGTQSTGKVFDAIEESALDQFIAEYSRIKGFSRKETCERIWTNGRRKDDFWINICKVLPYRTRSSIYKHVRRRYHIFEQRGKWTPEEDAELAKLCVEKEGQWSEVGKYLGRMPEDCRDRWRNYIKCGSKRASNKWTPEEEEKLKDVIARLIFDATGQKGDFPERKIDEVDEDGLEIEKSLPTMPKTKENQKKFQDIINWTLVSERMDGARSRIQCRYKWNKLVKKQAIQRIQNISEDTKKWTLEKLRDLGFTEDSQVDWDELATLCPDTEWSGLELKLSYEKLRTLVKDHKSKNINEISKELLGIIDGPLQGDKDS
ncbi:similar to Saccharomyces cerevisiae YDR026C Protein of unknown function that may interact with ribosomes, based on co-purification experiments [Maudiozyma barnettii]|uniref:DNA-binding protein REB1 n=1 Tax=Maudiozyma barnettii TaxID=61262 RepID=A0A8H2ZG81_9SACH|nr:Nsi1p [Kazachstania barnettii]CAB4253135.1 similar to Saccharomyces cerevisiae YDR026C Protein of unknown function that may interact with ribosomes, based on co-purification experiments [Kazachstania barnettii]CAD1780329.1 similar to Saccharomyces cerevisiae YDR026C Protein of unknown function that may interact with ribosomes, based on co-purification experiments [Kazachstania barnettii]